MKSTVRLKCDLYLLEYLLLMLSPILPCILSECVTTIGCLKDTTTHVSQLVKKNDELISILSSLHDDLQQGNASANFFSFSAKPCKFLRVLLCSEPLRMCDFDSSYDCNLYTVTSPFELPRFVNFFQRLYTSAVCDFAVRSIELEEGKMSPCTQQAKFCNFGYGTSSDLKPCPPISGCYEYGLQPIWSILRSSAQCGLSVDYAGKDYECVPDIRIPSMIPAVNNGPSCAEYLQCDGTYICRP